MNKTELSCRTICREGLPVLLLLLSMMILRSETQMSEMRVSGERYRSKTQWVEEHEKRCDFIGRAIEIEVAQLVTHRSHNQPTAGRTNHHVFDAGPIQIDRRRNTHQEIAEHKQKTASKQGQNKGHTI
jgi:hypothetical protein